MGLEDLNLVELNFGNIRESQNWTLYKDIILDPLAFTIVISTITIIKHRVITTDASRAVYAAIFTTARPSGLGLDSGCRNS